MTIDEATQEARRAGENASMDRLVERLAELVGGKASVDVVFGQPIRHGEMTVVPVARVRWGFGGGGGRADEPPAGPAAGSGGGGGVAADPIGYLEISGDGATFRPIGAQYPGAALLLAAGVAAGLVIRAVARLRRP